MIDYNDDGKFVIRGCYSCKYWANHEKIQEKIQNKFSMPTIAGLNGRYDFILELSEKDFYEIYQFIVTYKKEKKRYQIIHGKTSKEMESIWYIC